MSVCNCRTNGPGCCNNHIIYSPPVIQIPYEATEGFKKIMEDIKEMVEKNEQKI